jgi:hypothetical protein
MGCSKDSQYFDSITKKNQAFKKDMSSVCIYRGLEPSTLQCKERWVPGRWIEIKRE